MEFEAVRKFVRGTLEGSLMRYVQDLEAIPADKFDVSPGGSARSAADFTHECVLINNRIAAVLNGETPAQQSSDGWVTATAETREQAASIQAFKASADALLAVFDSLSEADLSREVPSYRGMVPAYELAAFAGLHTSYHDAQLNYLQAINGDDEMHWG